ncbi:MAG TPA: hypothetical protein VG318_16665 [Actinomycetota bacterium]|nr:hypothetical protein [Actinomycetota bacterium]
MRGRLRVVSVIVGVMGLAGTVVPAPASAVEVAGIYANIYVNTSTWDACGEVGDRVVAGSRYTAVLTVTGVESTVAANGTLVDYGIETGNPATPCTSGGFDSSYAVMVYTLTWTSIFGTTGTLVKTCVEALRVPICTVS